MKEATKEINRLTAEAYAALEKSLPPMAVSNDTSAMQAGYQLGIQMVLRKLREGFVIG
jgi:hypothetical protein